MAYLDNKPNTNAYKVLTCIENGHLHILVESGRAIIATSKTFPYHDNLSSADKIDLLVKAHLDLICSSAKGIAKMLAEKDKEIARDLKFGKKESEI